MSETEVHHDAYGKQLAITDRDVRCWRCGRLLAELLTAPWLICCGRCKARNLRT